MSLVVVVDTNILVYAADADSQWHMKSRAWIEERRSRPDAWYVTWPILYEFMRVTTHPRVMRKPWTIAGAWAFLSTLLASPGLGILVPTERHAAVAARLIAELPWLAGNLIHDAHTAVLMREHGIARICTRDADFRRFAFLDVVEPH
jgi:toxin-antitoxin system PIN domain toxin